MIKFFRHIRQKLLSENKFTKYLLYAIGEIILVVIGILIALQVNNWNNLKTERQIEKTYLEALQSEFRTNLKRLNTALEQNEQLVVQLDELLTFFEKEKLDTTSSAAIANAVGTTLRYEVFYNPSTGVQTDIISSGNLKQLKNPFLRQKIASFGNAMERIKRQESRAAARRNNLGAYMNEKISLRSIFKAVGNDLAGSSQFEGVAVKKLFDYMAVENDLILYQAISQTTNSGYYAPLKEDIEEILEIIDAELQL